MALINIRRTLRQIIKAPAFSLTAIITLAIGITANTAIFSVISSVLLHPPGVAQPDRVAVMKVRRTRIALEAPAVSAVDYVDVRSLKQLIQAVAIGRGAGFNLVLDNVPEHLAGERVSSEWFQVFGARPVLGRVFTEEEDQPNAAPVVLLSYGMWQTFFGGQANIVGRKIMLDREPYEVIGVLGPSFSKLMDAQLWVPIQLPATAFAPDQRFYDNYRVVVRLRPRVPLNLLNAALTRKVDAVFRNDPAGSYARRAGWSIYATPFTEFNAGFLVTPLRLLLVVVAMVLLIASANVAGLMLARSASRTKDFVIQLALGASTSALVRQAMLESLFLSSASGLVAVAAGPVLGKLLLTALPYPVVRDFPVHFDLSVLAFTGGAGLVATFIAGLGPVFRIARYGRRLRLHDGTRHSRSAGLQRLHNAFIVGQVALACLLLSATGLFLASLHRLQKTDLGFVPHNMFAAQVLFSGDAFKKDPARQASFVDEIMDKLAAKPGIGFAAAVVPLPLDPTRTESGSFSIENHPAKSDEPAFQSDQCHATPGYLEVAQIPLREGRWFTEADRANSAPVVVIDETLARRYWPHEDPIGSHLRTSDRKPWATVIGVVGSIHNGLFEGGSGKGVRYYPFAQGSDVAVNFVVRSNRSPADLGRIIKDAVAEAGPEQAVSGLAPMEEMISDLLAGRRLIAYLLAAFAAFAVLLAVLGVYGLTSYVTSQRTQEIGVRMALGAERFDVVWLVLSRSLGWIFLGLCVGFPLSFGAIVMLRHQFAALGGSAPLILSVAALPLFISGLMASLMIACRAAFIDPVRAIQVE